MAQPPADPWPPYHEALGRFLIAYANTEMLLHLIVHEHAGVQMDILRCLVGGPRTPDLIRLIKRLMKVQRVPDDLALENERCFQQLSQISTMRDLLLHRKTEYVNGRFFVHDIWSAKISADAKFHIVSVALLQDMTLDLRTIEVRTSVKNMPATTSSFGQEAQTAFSSPWRYKPEQPKTRAQIFQALQQPPPQR
jgi:hypothetical protein